MKKVWIFVLVGMFVLSACITSQKVMEVHELWTRSAAQGNHGAVYMTLHNHTDVDDELVGAASDVAEVVEIHESKVDENGVMQMNQVPSLPLVADGEIVFEPGGLHIMLINLKQELKAGDEINVTLQFKNHEDIVLSVPVMDSANMGDHDMP